MPSSRTSGAEPLFLDTSVLVRLEPEDPFEWAVDLAQRPGTLLAASHLAYVETLATFHALRRGRAITSRRQASLSAAFRADWPAFLRVPLSPPVVQLAGALAEEHPLRGADALQLTPFAWLWEKEGKGLYSFIGGHRSGVFTPYAFPIINGSPDRLHQLYNPGRSI